MFLRSKEQQLKISRNCKFFINYCNLFYLLDHRLSHNLLCLLLCFCFHKKILFNYNDKTLMFRVCDSYINRERVIRNSSAMEPHFSCLSPQKPQLPIFREEGYNKDLIIVIYYRQLSADIKIKKFKDEM